MSPFDDDLTLAQAKEMLRVLLQAGHAIQCPTCQQLAKVYRRKISSRMAFTLIEVWNAAGNEWCHVPTTVTFTGDSGEISKLRYWGLVEEETVRREDGGRAGYWRVTNLGRSWLLGNVRVAKYARIYDGNLLNLDESERVSITDALGDKFDYRELMNQ